MTRTPSRAFADAVACSDHVGRWPTPAAASDRARELFRAGSRLDMAAPAGDLGGGSCARPKV